MDRREIAPTLDTECAQRYQLLPFFHN